MKDTQAFIDALKDYEYELNRDFNKNDIANFYFIHFKLGMELIIIDSLIEFCKRIGKTSTEYIVSIAKQWKQEGILTFESLNAADMYLYRTQPRFLNVLHMVHINRNMVTDEECMYIDMWYDEWGVDKELIEAACQRAVDIKAVAPIKYAHAVLESWISRDIYTLGELTKSKYMQRTYTENQFLNYTNSTSSKDIQEFEQLFVQSAFSN